jgi:NADH-quinone oxidoreductase subunit E
VATVLGAIFGGLAIRRSGIYFAMITLGFAQLIYFLVVQLPWTGGEDGLGFYSLFYEEKVGKYVLEICNDVACCLRGAEQFVEMAGNKLGIGINETTEDGLFTIKTVMCLAACDRAPMLQCNLKFHENLDTAKFDALIADLRKKAAEGDETAVVEKINAYAKQA